MRQYHRNESDTTVDFFDTVMAFSDRSGPASLPCLLQRRSQGKLILTPALRESRLAITENTEKKDVYLRPFHINQLMVCEDKSFASTYAPRYVQLKTS